MKALQNEKESLDQSFSKYKQLLAQFFPTAQLQQITPLGNGHIHQTFLVETLKGSCYVLQQINTKVFQQPKALMQNLVAVGNYLKEQRAYEMEVLYPIPTTKGQSYHIDENQHYWRLLPYFSKSISLSKIDHLQQAHEAAYAYGHFAWALSNFPVQQLHETIKGFHNSLARYQTFLQALHLALPDRKKEAAEWIGLLQENINVFHEIAALELPLRVVHNDTKIDNVLLSQVTEKGLCVIDLDTLMPGILLSDFGDMVRTFCNSEAEDSANYEQIEVQKDIFEVLCRGYLSGLKETIMPIEKANLFLGAKWIILEQAMRFLWDYLANDLYYPIEYPTHNLVRAGNQMKLFQSLLRQEKELAQFLR